MFMFTLVGLGSSILPKRRKTSQARPLPATDNNADRSLEDWLNLSNEILALHCDAASIATGNHQQMATNLFNRFSCPLPAINDPITHPASVVDFQASPITTATHVSIPPPPKRRLRNSAAYSKRPASASINLCSSPLPRSRPASPPFTRSPPHQQLDPPTHASNPPWSPFLPNTVDHSLPFPAFTPQQQAQSYVTPVQPTIVPATTVPATIPIQVPAYNPAHGQHYAPDPNHIPVHAPTSYSQRFTAPAPPLSFNPTHTHFLAQIHAASHATRLNHSHATDPAQTHAATPVHASISDGGVPRPNIGHPYMGATTSRTYCQKPDRPRC